MSYKCKKDMIESYWRTTLVWVVRDISIKEVPSMTSSTEPSGKGMREKLSQLDHNMCVIGEITADQLDGQLGTFMMNLILKDIEHFMDVTRVGTRDSLVVVQSLQSGEKNLEAERQ